MQSNGAGRLELQIQGMTCASCVRRVEKAIGAVEGVAEASVNLAMNTARVHLDPSVASRELVVRAIEDAGYGDGRPIPRYLDAVRQRFRAWILDTASANYDQRGTGTRRTRPIR